MIYFFHPSHALFSIPAPTLAISFVTFDFAAFIIQLIGGAWAGPTAPPEQQLKGVHIYMGGIGIQQFFICLFLGLAIKFQLDMARLERAGRIPEGPKRRWRRPLYTVYTTLGLISVSLRSHLPLRCHAPPAHKISPQHPTPSLPSTNYSGVPLAPHLLPPDRILLRHVRLQRPPEPRSLLLPSRRRPHVVRRAGLQRHASGPLPCRTRGRDARAVGNVQGDAPQATVEGVAGRGAGCEGLDTVQAVLVMWGAECCCSGWPGKSAVRRGVICFIFEHGWA
jgi:hypothetical protein